MASAKDRWLSHMTLRLGVKGRPHDPLSLPEAFDFISETGIAGAKGATLIEDRWIVQLADVDCKTHPGHICALFLAIDKEAASAVYGDVNELNLRKVLKKKNEGSATSAHLIISRNTRPGLNDHYAILEEAEGLGRSRIVSYLRWLFDHSVPFVDRAGTEDELVESMLHVDAVLDKPLQEQLADARLISVEVFKRKKNSTIDRRTDYYERTKLIEYKPNGKIFGKLALVVIRSILEQAPKEEYPEVRVRIQEPSGNSRTVTGDREKQNILIDAFQLKSQVQDISPELDQASKSIVKHLVQEVLTHFPKNRRR